MPINKEIKNSEVKGKNLISLLSKSEHNGTQNITQVMRSPPPDLRDVLDLVPHPPQEVRVVDRRAVLRLEHPLFHVNRFPVGQRLLLLFRPQPPCAGAPARGLCRVA